MRKWLIGFAVTAMVLSVAGMAAVAGESPETATIDDCVDKKAAVEFPHKAHFEVTECTTCHHTTEGLTADADLAVEPCSACHMEPEADTTPACSQMSLKKNPYHISCVGCHKESGKETAPTKCDDCHPKAE